MTAPTIYFLRHGETDYNAEGRLQGQLDTPLNARGRDQAAGVGRDLAARLPLRGVLPATLPFFASPLGRTTETARIARAAMQLDPDAFATDPRLMELNFGRWQNLRWPDIRLRDGGAALRRDRDIWHMPPPGGESYADLSRRVRSFLDERDPRAPLALVSHGGVARVLMVLLGGVAPEVAAREKIAQGRILLFEGGAARWL